MSDYSAQSRHILEKVAFGKLSKSKAAKILGVSRKTIYSLLWNVRLSSNKIEQRNNRKLLYKEIIKIVLTNPLFGPLKISAELNKIGKSLSVKSVWLALKDLSLDNQEKRAKYSSNFIRRDDKFAKRTTYIKVTPEARKRMVEDVIFAGRKVKNVTEYFGVTRKTFAKWKRRYLKARAKGLNLLEAVSDNNARGTAHPRGASESVANKVIDIVISKPYLSSQKIANELGFIGNHGVQGILERSNLSHYEQRMALSERTLGTIPAPVTRPAVEPVFAGERAGLPFIPRWQFLKTFVFTSFLTFATIFSLLWWINLISERALSQALGTVFASVALLMGSVFFLYSLKYYLSLAIVLSFSQQEIGVKEGTQRRKGLFSWILGLAKNGNGDTVGLPRAESRGPVGLTPNLEHIIVKRHPKISVHIPLYNEKNVVERLLTAVSSFDYKGSYEVIIADDSNDDTTRIVENYLKENSGKVNLRKIQADGYTLTFGEIRPGVVIKHLHRKSRSGFKGGALREALKHTDPRAEFVSVFDADFVPYPDTLELFLKYFKVQNSMSEDYSQSKVAAVQGYQWHVLNKSENWITRGVRSEYAGSYVIERSGAEIYTGLKQISGSVYMIRRDVLEEIGWETSITEDFQLTLKLYEKGYKVVYTPYIQAPAECVSTLKRLIRQRMRWAEGHSNNIKKMFARLILNPKLSLSEKLEFIYLSPYYLQAFFFLVGTLSWLISETLFPARLPFWTSLWGWSLVLTNFLSLPLMNAVGLFLEESEEKDYIGLTSFAVLSYVLVPFQAYASLKGFIEKEEGPWFRTPKTGRITDIIRRGTFYRLIAGILPGRVSAHPNVATNEILRMNSNKFGQFKFVKNSYLALSSANNRFNSFNIKPRGKRWLGKGITAFFLIMLLFIHQLAFLAPPAQATFNPAWYNTDWLYRMKITIDQAQVAGSADHLNFPVLISSTVSQWAVTGSGGHVQQADGGDILFTASNGTTKLSHEIEEYTSTTGALRAWVEVGTLDFDTNTDIYIYYGNSTGVADQWDINGTWNPVYTLVYHFENDSFTDSRGTSNATNQSTTNVAGIVGDGRDANGSSQYVETNYTPAFTSTDDFSISVWASADVATGRDELFGTEDADGAPSMEVNWRDDTDIIGLHIQDDADSGGSPDCSNSTINNGTIHQIALQHDDNANPSILSYFDGATLCNNAASVANGAHTQGCELFIGAQDLCGTGAGAHFNGQIDEFRLSITLLSAGWMETDYNTISSPSTFYSVASGAEEQVPEIVVLLLPLAIVMPLLIRNLKQKRKEKAYAIVKI